MATKPKILLQKTRTGLVPLDAYSAARIEGLPLGSEFSASATTKRANKQNGLYWSILREVIDATGLWSTEEHLHNLLKMDLGYRSLEMKMNGEKHWVPDSTAFNEMDQEKFDTYFKKAMARLSEVAGYDVLGPYNEMKNQNEKAA